MYFEKGIALHGAFWHSSFGKEHSHGCVNMLPHDARLLFQCVGPKLPEGWHAVRGTAENLGTRVIVILVRQADVVSLPSKVVPS